MPNQPWKRVWSLCAGAGALIFVAGCGGGDGDSEGPLETVKKQDARTLRASGTAENEQEAVAQQKPRVDDKARVAAYRKVKKAFSKLKKAEDDFDRADALSDIVGLGEAARPHLDEILPFLKAEGADLRMVALEAVTGILGADAEVHLRRALKDDNDEVKAEAVLCWGKAGCPDLSPVLGLLDDFSDRVQLAAVRVLIQSPSAAMHAPALIKAMPLMDAAAVKPALKYFLETNKKLASDAFLVDMLDHDEPLVRTLTVQGIGALMRQTPVVKAKLVRVLGDDPDIQVLSETHKLLKAWAGTAAPDFDPEAEDADRAKAVEAWKAWLK